VSRCRHVDRAPTLEALQLPDPVVDEESLGIERAQRFCPLLYRVRGYEVGTEGGGVACQLCQRLDAEFDVMLLPLERTMRLIAVKKPLHKCRGIVAHVAQCLRQPFLHQEAGLL
jgi:hypothetical protein